MQNILWDIILIQSIIIVCLLWQLKFATHMATKSNRAQVEHFNHQID